MFTNVRNECVVFLKLCIETAKPNVAYLSVELKVIICCLIHPVHVTAKADYKTPNIQVKVLQGPLSSETGAM